ncbi:glycosyltransferase family protein [Prochlorothrix hollandica]|uniref:Uncharacterized protein n=1 Tax=Prochlorothrix hollandica PCC 9006 = CALU 1027 TaxID=317619 RepID=A0A0M2PSL7_PROHO|nr:hypothetical protein [Prochlorothrix hollandica]KKI99119.1 hypothetical protein PROH_15195 [Prochlorothrix hollandica PCC 9006 = CALU 1027]
MLELLPSPLAIVMHDAGAANHIIAWFRFLSNQKIDLAIHACVTGPASSLWLNAFPHSKICSLTDALLNCKILISGTGWQSHLEHEARKIARDLKIKSVAVIDHWTNYCDRFIRDAEEVLPDEIWVTDEYAKKLAMNHFPNLPILQLPNLYLDNIVGEVQSAKISVAKSSTTRLLYVLEPIRQVWDKSDQQGEFQALDFFINNIDLLECGKNISIKLRPHPSDHLGKYNQWIKLQNKLNISLDDSLTLAEAIAWSNIVVGCQTYAMVVALASGKKVVCSIPPGVATCILPQTEIIKLADLDAGNPG